MRSNISLWAHLIYDIATFLLNNASLSARALMAIRAKLAAVATSSYRATLAILAVSADGGRNKKIKVNSAHRAWKQFALTKKRGDPRPYNYLVCIGHLIKREEPWLGRA